MSIQEAIVTDLEAQSEPERGMWRWGRIWRLCECMRRKLNVSWRGAEIQENYFIIRRYEHNDWLLIKKPSEASHDTVIS